MTQSDAVIVPLKILHGEGGADAQQRRASDPSLSAWVSASAGSGKTKVLVDRVVRLLLDGVRPEKILCLTFTRAAAAQMSLKIMERLSVWAVCDENKLRYDLDKLQGEGLWEPHLDTARKLFARVLSCPGGMRIKTIHSFCEEILRRFPLESGLPPYFKVIEEADAKIIQRQVRDTILLQASQPANHLYDAMMVIATDLGEKKLDEFLNHILQDRAKMQNVAGMDELRQKLELAEGEDRASILKAFAQNVREDDLREVARLMIEKGKDTHKKRGQSILNFLSETVDKRTLKFNDYCDLFFTGDGGVRANLAGAEVKKINPLAEGVLSNEVTRLMQVLARLEAVDILKNTRAVMKIADVFLAEYDRRKASQASLDFSDLVYRAQNLLTQKDINAWVLYKLDGGIDHILVDEAQDTSIAQWDIVRALTAEFFAGKGAKPDLSRTLFVVGDEKQSIFSFQQADPKAFKDMHEFFRESSQPTDKPMIDVAMNTSFRSAQAVLDAVDRVFENSAVRAGVASVPIRHVAHNQNLIGRVEVWPLVSDGGDAKKAEPDILNMARDGKNARDLQSELAEKIATRIGVMLKNKDMIFDEKVPNHLRAISAGDIMILLRRRGSFADLMVRALKQKQIPVVGVDRMQLNKQLAVMDLLAIIQFVLLPEDDLNLATILRGPLLDMGEADLMRLALWRTGTIWHNLQQSSDFAPVRDYLENLLGLADRKTPLVMLMHILDSACPAGQSGRLAISTRLGFDALDPIDELLTAAQEFGQSHTPSLQAFLHWMNMSEAEIKREMENAGGQVRIMTAHASKGLEAPVVFLADAMGVPRKQNINPPLWHGNIPVYVTSDSLVPWVQGLRNAALDDQMQEYRRLLYVAMTRAKFQLMICGWDGKNNKDPQSWHALALNALGATENITEDASSRSAESKKPSPREKLPDWIYAAPTPEPSPPRPLTPSQASDTPPSATTPSGAFLRGRLVHRLLEILPDLPDVDRQPAGARFLKHQKDIDDALRDEILTEVMAVLGNPDYAPLFMRGSRAEVPIIGRIGDRLISGQIDRLCIQKDAVWIIDYKTNRLPPQNAQAIPPAYQKQMQAYRAVLKAIYPDKAVRCFLLWTCGGARMMEVAESLETRQ